MKTRLLYSMIVMLLLAAPAGAQQARVTADAMVNQWGPGLPREAPRSAGMAAAWGAGNHLATPDPNVMALRVEDAINAGFNSGRPNRIGIAQEVNVASDRHGRWTQLADGGWLWTFAFEATGGQAIQLAIDDWHPGDAVEIRVFDPHDPTVAFGPIGAGYPTAGGRLWTPIIFGPRMSLEYYLPPGIEHRDPERQITVSLIGNFYDAPAGRRDDIPVGGELPCHLDVSCFPPYQLEADGIAKLVFFDSGGQFFNCTGGLLNRAPGAEDSTPIFLTAAHCLLGVPGFTPTFVLWFDQTDG
ncbi:MAG: hypothetical protein ACYS0D_14455, partial [Planctomycetota bacterium]